MRQYQLGWCASNNFVCDTWIESLRPKIHVSKISDCLSYSAIGEERGKAACQRIVLSNFVFFPSFCVVSHCTFGTNQRRRKKVKTINTTTRYHTYTHTAFNWINDVSILATLPFSMLSLVTSHFCRLPFPYAALRITQLISAIGAPSLSFSLDMHRKHASSMSRGNSD